jgi:hypothetical protein
MLTAARGKLGLRAEDGRQAIRCDAVVSGAIFATGGVTGVGLALEAPPGAFILSTSDWCCHQNPHQNSPASSSS